MNVLHSLLLGIVQGLTEFLPVSSTAHLTFLEQLWKVDPGLRLSYDVALHLGTTAALIIFFRQRIIEILSGLAAPEPERKRRNWFVVLYIAIGTIPAGLAGLLLRNQLEVFFSGVRFPAIFLLVTGVVLFLTSLVNRKSSDPGRGAVNWHDGLFIGIAQAIALLPGISRSGATISTALFRGLNREQAFEFSFLLSIPAVLGAALLKVKDVAGPGVMVSPVAILAGIAASFAVGLVALALLRRILIRRGFHYFAWYCWIVGAAVLVFSLSTH